MPIDVVGVTPQPDHTLVLEFENGETRLFDMTPYLDERPFTRLKNSPLFSMAKVEYGTEIWPGKIDIAPEALYDGSRVIRSSGPEVYRSTQYFARFRRMRLFTVSPSGGASNTLPVTVS